MTVNGSPRMNSCANAIDHVVVSAYQRLDQLMQTHAAAGQADKQAVMERASAIFAEIEAALTLADLLGLME